MRMLATMQSNLVDGENHRGGPPVVPFTSIDLLPQNSSSGRSRQWKRIMGSCLRFIPPVIPGQWNEAGTRGNG